MLYLEKLRGCIFTCSTIEKKLWQIIGGVYFRRQALLKFAAFRKRKSDLNKI